MYGVDLFRNRLALERAAEHVDRVGRLRPSAHDAVDPELVVRLSLADLPCARAAEDDLEVRPIRVALDDVEHAARVKCVDGLARAPEDRRVDARGEGRAEWVVRRNADGSSRRAEELL